MPKQYLTKEMANNLYWFGRYIKRLEIELDAVEVTFDKVIDVDPDAGRTLFARLGATLHYKSATEYLQEAIYGEHPVRLFEIVQHLRENAIIARNYLHADTFAAVIQLHRHFAKHEHSIYDVDYHFFDHAFEMILQIWGGMHQYLQYHKSDRFIQLGEMIEKVDLRIRLDEQMEFALLLLEDIDVVAKSLTPDYRQERMTGLRPEKMLQKVNRIIDHIVVDKNAKL